MLPDGAALGAPVFPRALQARRLCAIPSPGGSVAMPVPSIGTGDRGQPPSQGPSLQDGIVTPAGRLGEIPLVLSLEPLARYDPPDRSWKIRRRKT